MSFLNHPKEPERPIVTACRSKEVRGKNCTNMNSRLFEIRAIKDKGGYVASWEIECPFCGTVWYKDLKRSVDQVTPRKHRKINRNQVIKNIFRLNKDFEDEC